MKSLVLYLIVLVGGAAAGAFGVGAYNVVSGAAVVEDLAGGEGADSDTTHAGQDAAEPDGTGATSGQTAAEPPRPVVDDGPSTADALAGDSDQDLAAAEDAAEQGVEAGGGSPPAQSTPEVAASPVVQLPPPDPDSIARMTERYQRLARIFSAMKPDEAAPVLAQLDDAQLEGILLAMQGRNAAPILAEMDPERAAALSRKVLRGNE